MKLSSTLVFVLMMCMSAHAQVFVNPDATGTNDGTSWANAFTNLQDALDQSDPDDQIWLAAGKYVPQGPTPDSTHFLATHAVHIYGGFAGTETSVSQRDWVANLSILSGDVLGDDIMGVFSTNRTDNAHHVLIINAPNTESVVDGLVFESGITRLDTYAPGPLDIPYNRWSGGALYLYRSGAVVRNTVFHNNDAIRGSGCYAFGDTLHTISLEFDHVVFRDNNGFNGAGAFLQAFQNLTVKNSKLKNNSGFQGGALFFSGSNATVRNCELDSNVATYGGAIMIFHSNVYVQHPELKVLNSSFTGNTASAWGGGLFVNNTYGGFSVEVDSCSFTGNSTETNGYGGGIEIWDAQDALPVDPVSTINITNSEYIANSSGFGGGVEIEFEDDSVKIVIENVKFEANSAIRGGGLNVYAYTESKIDFYMRNTDFTGNVAAIAGGMSMEGINNTYPLTYLLEDCSFHINTGENGIGALNIQHHPRADGISGTIRRALFEDNHGGGLGGAFTAFHGSHLVEDSYFLNNSTDATLDSVYHGGGAINIVGPAEFSINRNTFEGNKSLTDGAAITVNADVIGSIDNTLFHHQEGNSSIYNAGNLSLRNNTLVENERGLNIQFNGSTEIQNSIFDNQGTNLEWNGKATVISKGGNISGDVTMESILTGHAGYSDMNDTDPLLGLDYVPVSGSPAIDLGNADGIKFPYDLAGNARVQGGAIDAGSFESFLSATHHAIWNAPELSIFPNPVKDELNVKMNVEWTGDVQLLIYNQAGQQVHKAIVMKTHGNEILQSIIHHVLPGEYYLLVRANNDTYATNLVVVR